MENAIIEIMRILKMSELAQSKVELTFDGTKTRNRMQQGASNRLYKRALKLANNNGIGINEFIKIHQDILAQANKNTI